MKALLCCACMVFVILGAYGVGLRQAHGQDCYESVWEGIACNGCTSNLCAPCSGGVCPGDRKLCGIRWSGNRVLEGNYSYSTLEPCYELYDCRPVSGSSCSAVNPCTTSDTAELSSSTFSNMHFYGDCPGSGGGDD